MSSPAKTSSKKRQPVGDYDVGYGRPPQATRFSADRQPARKGRPSGRENSHTIMQRIIDFKVDITLPSGKRRKMILWEAAAWKQAVKAAQGDTRAFNALNDLAERFGVVLFQPPQLDAPLTEEEYDDIESFFFDWAVQNPRAVLGLLHRLELAMPVCRTIPGRDSARVRRIDFSLAFSAPTPHLMPERTP